MISDIKKKIISLKLDKNNKEIYTFNTKKNNKKEENIKRECIINMAKNKLLEEPKVSINIGNNF